MLQGVKCCLLALLIGLSLPAFAALDLNSATAEQLAEQLQGVGMTKAQEIVRYRQDNGPFVSVDQLVEVKGIGAILLEKNRQLLTVEQPTETK
ncbi:ComEA family DNA-binding protein [Motiliproteus sp.]|uniref:ComEA family DNA-binding protein n=1 Tax=Motiliproteus sp. TaxID=1898955 RepID=UPI003BA85398